MLNLTDEQRMALEPVVTTSDEEKENVRLLTGAKFSRRNPSIYSKVCF
jgi:hypothetical protein